MTASILRHQGRAVTVERRSLTRSRPLEDHMTDAIAVVSLERAQAEGQQAAQEAFAPVMALTGRCREHALHELHRLIVGALPAKPAHQGPKHKRPKGRAAAEWAAVFGRAGA